MKHNLLLTIAVAALTGWAGAEPAPPAPLAAKPIEVTVGKEFTITLEANHTTGFAWQLAKPVDAAVVKSVRHIYQENARRPKDGVPMVGGGGREIWTFSGVSAGKTVIEFHYARAWEKDTPPARSAKYEVVVKAADAK